MRHFAAGTAAGARSAPGAGPAFIGARAVGDAMIRLAYFAAGFTPIATLALSLVEVIPLHRGAPVAITGAVVIGTYLAVTSPRFRRPVAEGLAAGIVAVLIYDCTRLPFVVFGGWPDFIPMIGVWLYQDPDTHWSVGYLWRYLGNGGGMGLAFAMTVPYARHRFDIRTYGLVFGLCIWSGLMTTLAVAPNGEEKMFELNPATFTLSIVGHIVYGTVLGVVLHRRRDAD